MKHPEENISAYLAGELSAVEKQSLEQHLSHCLQCRTVYEQMIRLDAILADAGPLEPSVDFTEKVLRRVQKESRVFSFPSRKVLAMVALAAAIAFVVLVLRLVHQQTQVLPVQADIKTTSPGQTATIGVTEPQLAVTPEEKELIDNLTELENLDLITSVQDIQDMEILMMVAGGEERK